MVAKAAPNSVIAQAAAAGLTTPAKTKSLGDTLGAWERDETMALGETLEVVNGDDSADDEADPDSGYESDGEDQDMDSLENVG